MRQMESGFDIRKYNWTIARRMLTFLRFHYNMAFT